MSIYLVKHALKKSLEKKSEIFSFLTEKATVQIKKQTNFSELELIKVAIGSSSSTIIQEETVIKI